VGYCIIAVQGLQNTSHAVFQKPKPLIKNLHAFHVCRVLGLFIPVFRCKRSSVLHVIHETKTSNNATDKVFTLCSKEFDDGERENGDASCIECILLDNPCTVNRTIFEGIVDNLIEFISRRGIKILQERDYIDTNAKPTRRGLVLADDWKYGPAPTADDSGVIHARGMLSDVSLCGLTVWFMPISTDKYAKLRLLDLHVTCIKCLSLT
jgi:hypothetical protein